MTTDIGAGWQSVVNVPLHSSGDAPRLPALLLP